MSLPTASLGHDGPQVTRLGFGLMGLSSFYGTPKSDEERLALLDEAYKLGAVFWDSADMYAAPLLSESSRKLTILQVRRQRRPPGQMVQSQPGQAQGYFPRHQIRQPHEGH
jgi:aryl-alcohol dehydrogenase-like predicted oxidoreductase